MNASERGDEMMVPLLLIPLTPGWPGNPQTSGMFHFLYFDDTDTVCLILLKRTAANKELEKLMAFSK